MKTIYNTYVVMESQEQCDRMKQLCIDNRLPHWKEQTNDRYPFLFEEKSNSVFEFDCDYEEFAVWNGGGCKLYTQITEQEFIELLKNKEK